MLKKELKSESCKNTEFVLSELGNGELEIEAFENGDNVGGCFVNQAEVYGHYGFFDGGFPDAEVEKFAQNVFCDDIDKIICE